MKFINRQTELSYLNNAYHESGSKLVVLYGRRRVGKTRLLKEFVADKPHIYFLADKQLEIGLIARLKTIIASSNNDQLLEQLNFNNWDSLFNYWLQHADFSKKIVFVIDEFQYLAKVNPAFPSILQRLWDEQLQSKNIFLVLCGSLMSMMYRTTLSYESPLYGRRTGQIKLKSIRFADFNEFFPQSDFQQLVELYSIIGGVPKYIEAFDPQKNVFENIEKSILNRNNYLYEEPGFILNEELTETTTYFSILKSIADGEHKIGNIAAKLNMNAHNITKYLEILIDLDLLERQVPATENQPQKSKKGLYFIKDNFFRFWFHFIFPNRNQLELELTAPVLQNIKNHFSQFVALAFENICLDLLAEWNRQKKLPFEIEKWGRWWDSHQEIDLVAYNTNSHEILFGECKWTQKPVGMDVLQNLKQKVSAVNWFLKDRKEYFILLSKNGFTPELEKVAREEGILLVQGNLFLF